MLSKKQVRMLQALRGMLPRQENWHRNAAKTLRKQQREQRQLQTELRKQPARLKRHLNYSKRNRFACCRFSHRGSPSGVTPAGLSSWSSSLEISMANPLLL